MTLFDKIEQKRKEFVAGQDQKGLGTLSGLAAIVQKRKAMLDLKNQAKMKAKDEDNE